MIIPVTGKRKRNKKKKASGASNAAAIEEDEQVAESAAGPQADLGNYSQLEELNLNEIPDEGTLLEVMSTSNRQFLVDRLHTVFSSEARQLLSKVASILCEKESCTQLDTAIWLHF